MPIRKKEKKAQPVAIGVDRTAGYSLSTLPVSQAYVPIQAPTAVPTAFQIAGVTGTTASSDVNLNYFFELAASLYAGPGGPSPDATDYATPLLPGYSESLNLAGYNATMVLCLYRQTMTHIFPISERFHLGPADRQPLYAVSAQPSVRSTGEFNELVIKRRRPVDGAYYDVCTSDIEPSLDLVRPGSWRVSRLTLDAVPVWRTVVSGQVIREYPQGAIGHKMILNWGDRSTLGSIGDAYSLSWETGTHIHGELEAFYVVERWQGFDSKAQGIIRIKPAMRGPTGDYVDPRSIPTDLATMYFHNDGKTLPQFVCQNKAAQQKMDILMSGLMTVMVIETRRCAIMKEMGTLPAYDSIAQYNSTMLQQVDEDFAGQ